MKKIIAIAVIAIVSLAGVFAAAGSSAAVRLNGKVDETAYTPSLYYVVSDGKAESVGTSLYDIADGDSRWDLTKDGETNDFIVKVTGNMNTDKVLTVSVRPNYFTGSVNDKKYVTGVIPALVASGADGNAFTATVAAGKRAATDIAHFSFSWTGDKDLPAADYTSEIAITYSVNN